jgi:RNA polymerase sigma-70 factor (ECF subfamily)
VQPIGKITRLLEQVNKGNKRALSELFDEVYTTLRSLARGYMHRERPGHILQATAVVNEAYIRLFGGTPIQPQDHFEFYRAAAGAMRRLLIDEARGVRAQKRAGAQTTLHEWMSVVKNEPYTEIDLQRALDRLSQLDRRQAEVMELAIYAGRTAQEIAMAMNLAARTIQRDMASAAIFLRAELDTSRNDARAVGQS